MIHICGEDSSKDGKDVLHKTIKELLRDDAHTRASARAHTHERPSECNAYFSWACTARTMLSFAVVRRRRSSFEA